MDDTPTTRAIQFAENDASEVHALVVFVDYGFEPAKSMGWCPAGFGDKLDTYENAEMIVQLLEGAGCKSITRLSNQQATKEAVYKAIEDVGIMCDENDTFFFFYSGHGAQMVDTTGDEADGMDEAMCLPSADGNCNEFTWMNDDMFAEACAEVTAGQKVIIMDCCHSGTMLDFDRPLWHGQSAISMTGCMDHQESAGMAGGTRGGAFSKCLFHATLEIGSEEVSCGTIYNQLMTHKDEFVPLGHPQEIQLQCAPGLTPGDIMWPLRQKAAGEDNHDQPHDSGEATEDDDEDDGEDKKKKKAKKEKKEKKVKKEKKSKKNKEED